jgi:sugar lactone lactonase YvrE
MDETIYVNSVAFLPGDGVVFTKFFDPQNQQGFGAIMEGKATGGVYEWHPDTGIRPIAGTELAGANGIDVSKDGKSIYVAAWGTQELVRFTQRNGFLKKDSVKVDFSPDNLRWAPDGKILVAGQIRDTNAAGGMFGFKGWIVAKLDPQTMEIREVFKDQGESPLQNASVAIDVDGTLWIGSFRADRVAYTPTP